MSISLQTLKDYCKERNRICPIPQRWNELFKLLREKKPKEPSAPLILAAWWETNAIDKQIRFFQHLEWADKQGQLDEISAFILRLSENDWFHLGE